MWGLILLFSVFISDLQPELVYISALVGWTVFSCFSIFEFFRGKITWQQSKESVMPSKNNFKPMFNHWGHSFMPCLTIISEKGWLRFDCDVYEQTSLACTFCFPISDHVMPSWEFSFCLFISYVYICTCIRRHLKKLFPRVASRGLKWENKTYKLKRSIVWHRLGNRGLYPRNCFFF